MTKGAFVTGTADGTGAAGSDATGVGTGSAGSAEPPGAAVTGAAVSGTVVSGAVDGWDTFGAGEEVAGAAGWEVAGIVVEEGGEEGGEETASAGSTTGVVSAAPEGGAVKNTPSNVTMSALAKICFFMNSTPDRSDWFANCASIVCHCKVRGGNVLNTVRLDFLGKQRMALDGGSNGDRYGHRVGFRAGAGILEGSFKGPGAITVLCTFDVHQVLVCSSVAGRGRWWRSLGWRVSGWCVSAQRAGFH
ncbi:hypothetical protein ACT3TS_10585 [Specibacter sp. AOP5-B1-6]|uniref:hypothetical protein n=1 Tax=Specibacter sp. AOP5-B1-6 TaxID=3457653 RepID=UPI00402B2811